MVEHPLRILQVSTADRGGGAEKVAWNLFQVYRARGHDSSLAVGHKRTGDADVFVIPNTELRGGTARLVRSLERRLGIEDHHFPGTQGLLRLPRQRPDIVHCHNLHGGYFDLRALSWLSGQTPVFVSPHDAWLLSGNCAHSFACERWKTGCGRCPDLTIYPGICRDATAYNWRRKRRIYRNSRLYVSTPCRWLMQKVEKSMLFPAVVEARVVPYGVNLSVLHPAKRQAAREALGLPQDEKILLFAANGIRKNIWKDYQTMRAAVARVGEQLRGLRVRFLALGDDAPPERIGAAEIRFVPYQEDEHVVARYYQAADVYVHAAHADTFPNAVIEALACGTPVVATAVGGIPEQIRGLETAGAASLTEGLSAYGVDGATGVLVSAGDAEAMGVGIIRLLSDDDLRSQLGENAAADARIRFDVQRQAEDYLNWYQSVLQERIPPSSEREDRCGVPR